MIRPVNGSGMKRMALLNDLSCFGKCSLSVAMPILSSYGVETVPLPTAILSTHTADGFGSYVMRDMTDEMKAFAAHWRQLQIKFDGICMGFFGSVEQMHFAKDFLRDFAGEDTIVVVDPVLGDNGALYGCFTEEYVQAMRALCESAQLITPNRTEVDWLSASDNNVDAYIADPLCGQKASIGLFYEMLGGIRFISTPKNIASMNRNTPILFISGDKDPVGEMGRGVKRAYEAFRRAGVRDVELKLYKGLRHEILNEDCRAVVYNDLWSWIEKHL